jgi:glucose/arabinose dehydrogenase
MRRIFLLSCIVPVLANTFIIKAQPLVNLVPFASGLDKPVTITNARDNRLFIVEQSGRIRIVESSGVVKAQPFLDISVYVTGGNEQGLLGLAFHPDYASNGFFYVNYTGKDNYTHISRFNVSSANPDIADPVSEFPILSFEQPYSNHNGGDIKFGPDGYLYIAAGDGGSSGDPQNNAQDTTKMLGKILRINVDNGSPYAIPETNPFAGNKQGLDEIWAFGLRNPWRFSFDRITGDLWISDVGQASYEEINFQQASSAGGENYGWRCYEGTHAYDNSMCIASENYSYPVYEYSHNAGGCSVIGGFVYRGSKYPAMDGYYFFTDYCTDEIWSLSDSAGAWVVNYHDQYGGNNFSTFGEDKNGELYVAGVSSGNIYAIQDTSAISNIGKSNVNNNIRIYPNPFSDKLYIEIDQDQSVMKQFAIYDIYGRVIFASSTLDNDTHLNLDFLSPGVYFLTLKTGRITEYRELLKQ